MKMNNEEKRRRRRMRRRRRERGMVEMDGWNRLAVPRPLISRDFILTEMGIMKKVTPHAYSTHT